MERAIVKIGIREFRNNISKYLSGATLAVTNHGKTVGYYIPVNSDPKVEDIATLREAAQKMAALLTQNDVTEDELVADFRKVREGNRI